MRVCWAGTLSLAVDGEITTTFSYYGWFRYVAFMFDSPANFYDEVILILLGSILRTSANAITISTSSFEIYVLVVNLN